MTRYQLAKLVEWAGKLRSRKRMQKLVYLLQSDGCPLDADFILHRYGPYSQDVARLTDEMVQLGLLEEETSPNQMGQEYAYQLTERAQTRVAEIEALEQGAQLTEQMAPFEALVKQLVGLDVRDLEIAATIVYFKRQGHNLDDAFVKACQFKNLPQDAALAARGKGLAKKFAV